MSTTITDRPHYEAETCLSGGHLCGHRHRTRAAAERCLPRHPRNRPGSLTQYFSMACVRPMNEAARRRDAIDRGECYDCGAPFDRCDCR